MEMLFLLKTFTFETRSPSPLTSIGPEQSSGNNDGGIKKIIISEMVAS